MEGGEFCHVVRKLFRKMKCTKNNKFFCGNIPECIKTFTNSRKNTCIDKQILYNLNSGFSQKRV